MSPQVAGAVSIRFNQLIVGSKTAVLLARKIDLVTIGSH
jgi:hypothetical protein